MPPRPWDATSGLHVANPSDCFYYQTSHFRSLQPSWPTSHWNSSILENHILQFSPLGVSLASFSSSTGTLKFPVFQALYWAFSCSLFIFFPWWSHACHALLSYASDTQAPTSSLNFRLVYPTACLMFPQIWDSFFPWIHWLYCLFILFDFNFIRLPVVCLAVKPSPCWVVQTRGGGDHYTDKTGFLNF